MESTLTKLGAGLPIQTASVIVSPHITVVDSDGMPKANGSARSDSGFHPFSPTILLPLIASIAPLLLFRQRFALLYWFHDDWDLTSDFDRLGYWQWIRKPHAETYAPLFKALWIGAVHLVNGSYAGMIVLLWLTHLATLLLFAYILSQCGFGAKSQGAAILTAGLPWSNIETLAWATQWSAMLCSFFWLTAWAAAIRFLRDREGKAMWQAVAMVSAAASALCFVRGVITGAAVAVFVLLSIGPSSRERSGWGLAAGLAGLTLACFLAYQHLLSGLAQAVTFSFAKFQAMVVYGGYYLLANPLYHILPIPRKVPDVRALLIAGSCKVAIVGAALRLSSREQRTTLFTLLFVDFAGAAQLAFGRYALGVDSSISYRYQYVSLLCFAPFLGIAMATIASPYLRRRIGYTTAMVCWALLLGYPWARHSARWSGWRGIEIREAVKRTPDDERFGLPAITAGRARELIEKYNLH